MLNIADTSNIALLKKLDIREQVFDILLEQITTGVWKPGEKLPSENELTKTLGVSRISIREAIQKLAGLDLVESMQGKGSFVKAYTSDAYLKRLVPVVGLSKHEVIYLLEYREVLEIGVMGLAIERGKPEDVAILEEYTKKMEENLTDYKMYAHYDTLFHLKLSQMSENPMLEQASEGIRDLLEKQIQQTLTPEGAQFGVMFHTKITQAVKRKDTVAAVTLMKQLLENVIDTQKSKQD